MPGEDGWVGLKSGWGALDKGQGGQEVVDESGGSGGIGGLGQGRGGQRGLPQK